MESCLHKLVFIYNEVTHIQCMKNKHESNLEVQKHGQLQ